jgi:hypothetical protein
MSEETFLLDLEKVVLLGFQTFPYGNDKREIPCVSDRHVSQFVESIEQGASFPPVVVYQEDTSLYRLTFRYLPDKKRFDGGHHRAVAHYIVGVPLQCRFRNTQDIVPTILVPEKDGSRNIDQAWYPIKDFILADYSLFEADDYRWT